MADISPSQSFEGIKHKEKVDEYFRVLAPHRNDKAFGEYIEELVRIIEPGVQKDIKKQGVGHYPPVSSLKP